MKLNQFQQEPSRSAQLTGQHYLSEREPEFADIFRSVASFLEKLESYLRNEDMRSMAKYYLRK